MPTIGLATATAALGLDPDLAPLMDALTARGADTRVVCWDDDVAWDRFDAVVLRSTWDYPDRLREFLAWIDRVDATSTLLNPLPVVRWSIDKRYLLALAADGVPVVPTRIAGPADPIELPEAPEVVIKPSARVRKGHQSEGTDGNDLIAVTVPGVSSRCSGSRRPRRERPDTSPAGLDAIDSPEGVYTPTQETEE